MRRIKSHILLDPPRALLVILVLFFAFFSVYALKPSIGGDSLSYIDSMRVIRTGSIPDGFVPNRLLTTYAGLRSLMMLTFITGNAAFAWMLQNRILYVIFGLVFYALLKRLVEDRRAAFFATLFLITNYSAVSFGLGYLMDMGGWAFYVISLYFSYRYIESEDKKWMWLSAASIGFGGMFKEYAFLGYVALLLSVAVVCRLSWKELFKNVFWTGLISFLPVALVNVYVIEHFNYSYLSWFKHQGELYPNMNYPVEFVKCFGSLYNFGWFLFLHGAYLFALRTKELGKALLSDKKVTFTWCMVISVLPVFVWPPVTRVLFVTVPALAVISSLSIKKLNSSLWVVLPLLSTYFISSYLMDAYILNFVNLPF